MEDDHDDEKVMKYGGIIINSNTGGGGRKDKEEEEEEEEDIPLPGFRFHPTDEELVGFYLRRKVEKRPISIELIKQIDIYKHDPWDLPKASNVGGGGEKEWYFYCKRGRKYRNSIRPNRVTGSGFWKATGIDRPIYSSSSTTGRDSSIIGLKKSLVYYRGTAGKGTKTDWMMHEFRLPPSTTTTNNNNQEAEVWTLCRIFKRNVSYRKCMPDWKQISSSSNSNSKNKSASNPLKTSCSSSSLDNADSVTTNHHNHIITNNKQTNNYISFAAAASPSVITAATTTQTTDHHHMLIIPPNQEELMFNGGQLNNISSTSSSAASYSRSSVDDVAEFLKHATAGAGGGGGGGDHWDELRSVVDQFGAAHAPPAGRYYFL